MKPDDDMTKTPWFPFSTPPSRVGLYECKRCYTFHFWDGKTWYNSAGESIPMYFELDDRWRGLMGEAK